MVPLEKLLPPGASFLTFRLRSDFAMASLVIENVIFFISLLATTTCDDDGLTSRFPFDPVGKDTFK